MTENHRDAKGDPTLDRSRLAKPAASTRDLDMPAALGYHPATDLLTDLDAVLEKRRALTAWAMVNSLPDPGTWQGFEGRRIAAKLANALGNQRLGAFLSWRNWRENPDHDQAYFQALFGRFRFTASSLLLLEMEERLPRLEPGSEEFADLLGLIASCQVELREFQWAHRSLDRAMKDCEDPAWLWVQRSHAYQKEDRYEEALESILEGKKLKPWYRPVVETHASALINLNRDEEARQALVEATEHSDNPAFPLRLSVIHSELDEVEATSKWLDDYERKSPLLNESSRQWLAGRRADLCHLDGDLAGFLDLCKQTKKDSFHRRCFDFHQKNDGPETPRRKLDVTFVRQHNMTCAPATIAALTAYFGKAHDHLEIAEAICYDGTPWHKERQWCEEHGFAVREFPVTMEATKSLIDAGLPFTLTTQTIDSGHLQACIGYDEKLDLLLLRDPTLRHYGEVILSALQEDHPVFGLRGLALIPKEREAELATLPLKGQRPYDLYHQLSSAFEAHDEETIHRTMEAFRRECPEAPLRWQAECRLAARNQHPVSELEFAEKLIVLFPDHQSLWLQKLRILERLSRHTEARDYLAKIHRQPKSDPYFDMEMGEILCRDIRTLPLGQFYLRRALRQRPSSPQAHAAFASSLNVLGDRETALRFRRSASRLGRSFEPYAQRYHLEARYLDQEKEALVYLRERAAQTGDLEVSPHLTLLQVLAEQNNQEAPALAGELLARFPENGELLLETITLFSGWGRQEEARHHLRKADGKVTRAEYLGTAARFWSWHGDRRKSREHWEKLIELQPLNVSAYEAVARHLAEEQDRDRAVRFLKEAHLAHPDYLPLLKSYIGWEEFHGPRVSLPLLRKALELDPLDLWAIRELALELAKDGQGELAAERAREALAFDPNDASSHGILGLVQEETENKEAAANSFRAALTRDIDYLTAFEGLLRVKETFAGREESLRFVRDEMIRQVSDGSIVPAYRLQATGVIDSTEIEKDLHSFRAQRPDLWQTWGALAEHYHATSRHELGLKTTPSTSGDGPDSSPGPNARAVKMKSSNSLRNSPKSGPTNGGGGNVSPKSTGISSCRRSPLQPWKKGWPGSHVKSRFSMSRPPYRPMLATTRAPSRPAEPSSRTGTNRFACRVGKPGS